MPRLVPRLVPVACGCLDTSSIIFSLCRFGEAPRAYIVRASGSGLSAEDVDAFVKKNAASYKQLSGGIEFVESVPKSAAGKILRKDLAAKYKAEHGKK